MRQSRQRTWPVGFSVDCQYLIDQTSVETRTDRREIERGWVFCHMTRH